MDGDLSLHPAQDHQRKGATNNPGQKIGPFKPNPIIYIPVLWVKDEG